MSEDRSWEPQTLRSVKLAHMVALTVVEDIVSQGLEPGDRLPAEAAMLERFQVGRASIREGLRLLEAYGVISIKPGNKGGPVVRAPDATDLARTLSLFFRMVNATYRDLNEARLIIEPVMARQAAEKQDPEQLAELRRVMEQEQSTDLDNYLPSATAFHYTVAGASGNPLLDLLGRSLRVLYADQLTGKGLFPPEARPEVRRTHKEIGEAILAGEGELAERLMKEHMSDLAHLQETKTPAFMDERVSWEM